MYDFAKTLRIGTDKHGHNIHAQIKFDGKHLSITGVIGAMSNGDARGSAGQIIMEDWNISSYASGWNAAKVAQFRRYWERWHLNDMRAGTKEQEKALRDFKPTSPGAYYPEACEFLKGLDLYEVPDPRNEDKTYRYGHAWLHEDVPGDVLLFLKNLPDADIPLPARWR